MDKKKLLSKLEKLKSHLERGDIPQLHNHEVNPKLSPESRENYLYFIMTCSLNFQRSSPKTWESALNTWNDEETRFLFFPEKVVTAETETVRSSLLRHKLALQPNKHVEIWTGIMKTFAKDFDNDPRNLFKVCDFDTTLILKTITIDMKKSFPYLSGPKLSNYVLYILLHYSDLKLKNRNSLSVIPDTHIMQATEQLGILTKDRINPLNVQNAWNELLEGTSWAPVDFHAMLWNWSRNKFLPSVG